jgi:hypothetical protein
MRAKFVKEEFQKPFSNNLRNGPNRGNQTYPPGQYECVGKKYKKKNKKMIKK